mgnify:CR=1 FL=1
MKKNIGTIIILLIVFCICCSVTYFAIKDFGNNKNNTETKEENKEDNKESKDTVNVDRKKIEDAIEKIKVLEIKGKDLYPENFTNEDLLFFIYMNGEISYDEGISIKNAQEFTKKYLGVEVQEGSMPCPNGGDTEPKLIIFDKNSNKFIYNPEHDGHGGGGTALTTMNKIEKITPSGNEITVTVKKLFSKPWGDTDVSTLYYYNYKDAIEGDSSKVVYEDIGEELASDPEFDQGYNRLTSKIDYSKASTYEYKFKVIDGNYILISYKEIK